LQGKFAIMIDGGDVGRGGGGGDRGGAVGKVGLCCSTAELQA